MNKENGLVFIGLNWIPAFAGMTVGGAEAMSLSNICLPAFSFLLSPFLGNDAGVSQNPLNGCRIL